MGSAVLFWQQVFRGTLSTRRATIEEAIRDAERRQQEAKQALSNQQANLEQAQSKAKEIVATARENATKVSEDILAQAKAEVEKMQAAADQDVTFQQEKVMRELRQRIAEIALERAEEELPSRLTPDLQTALVDKSIALLGD